MKWRLKIQKVGLLTALPSIVLCYVQLSNILFKPGQIDNTLFYQNL